MTSSPASGVASSRPRTRSAASGTSCWPRRATAGTPRAGASRAAARPNEALPRPRCAHHEHQRVRRIAARRRTVDDRRMVMTPAAPWRLGLALACAAAVASGCGSGDKASSVATEARAAATAATVSRPESETQTQTVTAQAAAPAPAKTVTKVTTVAAPAETVTSPAKTVTSPAKTGTTPAKTVTEPAETVTDDSGSNAASAAAGAAAGAAVGSSKTTTVVETVTVSRASPAPAPAASTSDDAEEDSGLPTWAAVLLGAAAGALVVGGIVEWRRRRQHPDVPSPTQPAEATGGDAPGP